MNSIKIFILFVSAFGLQFVTPCPIDPSVIQPCTCEGATIKCRTITNFDLDEVMASLVKATGATAWDTLELSSTVMDKLSADIFQGVTFRVINIINGPLLKCVSPRAFSGMENTVQVFTTTFADFSQLDSDCNIFSALSSLKNLITISITGSQIKEIPDKAFHGRGGPLLSLNSIDFSGGQGGVITKVGQDAFSELNSLQKIDLSSHQIISISQFAFAFNDPSAIPLTINLEHNPPLKGDSFGSSAFDTNGRITTLRLGSNIGLKYLDQSVFYSYLSNKLIQNIIDLSGTPFDVNPNNEWLIENKASFGLDTKLTNIRASDGQPLWTHSRHDFETTTPQPHQGHLLPKQPLPRHSGSHNPKLIVF